MCSQCSSVLWMQDVPWSSCLPPRGTVDHIPGWRDCHGKASRNLNQNRVGKVETGCYWLLLFPPKQKLALTSAVLRKRRVSSVSLPQAHLANDGYDEHTCMVPLASWLLGNSSAKRTRCHPSTQRHKAVPADDTAFCTHSSGRACVKC